MTETMDPRFMDAEAFLMGGGGPASAFNKHDGVGTERGGEVLSWKMEQQREPKSNGPDSLKPKFWNDGNPMMQLIITVQTTLRDPNVEDDDGTRRFFVKGDLQKKLAAELLRNGVKFIERGGYLAFRRDHKEPDQGVMSGAWIHSCVYRPPAQQFLAAEQNGAQPAAAAAPAHHPHQAAPSPQTAAQPPLSATQSPAEAQAVANLAAAGMVAQPAGVPGLSADESAKLGRCTPEQQAAFRQLPVEQLRAVLATIAV